MKKLFVILALLVSSSVFAQKIYKGLPAAYKILDIPLPAGYTLWNYELSVLPTGNDLLGPYAIKNGQLSPEASKAVSHIRPGDKVYFEHVQAKDEKTGKIIRVDNYSTVLK